MMSKIHLLVLFEAIHFASSDDVMGDEVTTGPTPFVPAIITVSSSSPRHSNLLRGYVVSASHRQILCRYRSTSSKNQIILRSNITITTNNVRHPRALQPRVWQDKETQNRQRNGPESSWDLHSGRSEPSPTKFLDHSIDDMDRSRLRLLGPKISESSLRGIEGCV